MLKRFITSIAAIALLLASMMLPDWILMWMFVGVAAWGVTEMLGALTSVGHQPIRWSSYIAIALMIPAHVAIGPNAQTPILTVILLLTIANIAIRREPSWIDAATPLYAAFTIILPFLMMMELDALPSPLDRVMILACFAIPLAGDTLALYIGSYFGRHKLNEKLSPSKTIEGCVGGIAGSIIGGLGIYYVGGLFVTLPPWYHWIALGLVGGVAGQLGDFSASLVKRWCKIKDFGAVFPGHGGIMDRFDSVLFAVYIIYIYVYIINPGVIG